MTFPPRSVVLENVSPAQLALRYLAMEEATTIFGVPGAAIMQLLYELRVQSDTFDYVVCRHESGAAFMADGYARMSGKLGVAMLTSGPGATNALTGTMNAQASGTPVLTITGEVNEAFFGLGYLQEGIDTGLDIEAVYKAATGYSAMADNPANFATLFEQALRDALSVPSCGVHISLPADVAKTPIKTVTVPSSPANYRAVPQGSDPTLVAQALDLLLAAERPVFLLGNGSRKALLGNGSRKALRGARGQAFQAFVEKFAIPVMTTPEAKGVFPDTHELSLRNYGLAGCNWTTAYLTPPSGAPPYDGLIVVGSSLGELATTKVVPEVWSSQLMPQGPFIHIDLDETVIGRAFPVDIGIIADAGATIDQLVATGKGLPVPSSADARRAFIAQIKADIPPAPPAPAARTPQTVHPIDLMQALNTTLPPGTHVFVDAGNCVGWCNAYLQIDPPSEMHSALSMGPMGFAVCAVIGAKFAARETPCVAVVGDGALLMHGSEIATAAANGIGAVWVVLADADLTMVSQGMGKFFPTLSWDDYYSLGQTDIVGYATALGATACAITSASELPAAVEAALTGAARGEPQVLAVTVDPLAAPPYYAPGV